MRPLGAEGTATGVAAMLDTAPLPESFTARSASVYAVPLVRPVTVWLAVSASLPGMSAKLVPPSLLIW